MSLGVDTISRGPSPFHGRFLWQRDNPSHDDWRSYWWPYPQGESADSCVFGSKASSLAIAKYVLDESRTPALLNILSVSDPNLTLLTLNALSSAVTMYPFAAIPKVADIEKPFFLQCFGVPHQPDLLLTDLYLGAQRDICGISDSQSGTALLTNALWQTVTRQAAPASHEARIAPESNALLETFQSQVRDAEESRQYAFRTWRRLNRLAANANAEDGFEDEFTIALKRGLRELGSTLVAVFEAASRVDALTLNAQIEALKLFGRIKHPPTRSRRLEVLVSFLKHNQAAVRDAAAIGLGYMGGPEAAASLFAAAAAETDSEVKEFMAATARDLEEDRSAVSLAQDIG